MLWVRYGFRSARKPVHFRAPGRTPRATGSFATKPRSLRFVGPQAANVGLSGQVPGNRASLPSEGDTGDGARVPRRAADLVCWSWQRGNAFQEIVVLGERWRWRFELEYVNPPYKHPQREWMEAQLGAGCSLTISSRPEGAVGISAYGRYIIVTTHAGEGTLKQQRHGHLPISSTAKLLISSFLVACASQTTPVVAKALFDYWSWPLKPVSLLESIAVR
jgi:hypothetical protein